PPPPQVVNGPAPAPTSLVPMVSTPPRVQAVPPTPVISAQPAANAPVVLTPAGGPRADTSGDVKPAGFVVPDAPNDRDAKDAKVAKAAKEAAPTKGEDRATPRPLPPVPTVGAAAPADAKTARHMPAGAPLFRLVNTKRITLNFEVKDVGPSGLSGV